MDIHFGKCYFAFCKYRSTLHSVTVYINFMVKLQSLQSIFKMATIFQYYYTFRFVVGAAMANFVDIIILLIANSDSEVDTVIPMLEEKTNGAIMLY